MSNVPAAPKLQREVHRNIIGATGVVRDMILIGQDVVVGIDKRRCLITVHSDQNNRPIRAVIITSGVCMSAFRKSSHIQQNTCGPRERQLASYPFS